MSTIHILNYIQAIGAAAGGIASLIFAWVKFANWRERRRKLPPPSPTHLNPQPPTTTT
jgi:heme/copper-type cytochrome/quinol oxidase subunit 1